MKSDLHIHTTESDGCLSPEEVVRQAEKAGIEVLSITDHETTKGVEKAVALGKELGVQIIPGVEFHTIYNNEEIHLLGYYKDIENDLLQDKLKKLRQERTNITKQMIARLQQAGVRISWEEVVNVASLEGLVCKTHIMYAMQNKFDLPEELNWKEITSWFRRGGVAYIPFDGNPYQEAVDFIFTSGGLPVLAHPGLIKNRSCIKDLLSYRPIGLEVYYGYWQDKESTIKYFDELGKSHAVITTGGSDYHGFFSPFGLGEVEVPPACAKQLRMYLEID